MALHRVYECVTDKQFLLKENYITESYMPEAKDFGIDCPGRILGKVAGIGFMGDFMSDNDRWYPSRLWKKTIDSDYIKEQLESRIMFGECGHPDTDEGLDDYGVGNGKYSHNIVKLDYSNAPTGYIEYVIMDTNAGRNLFGVYSSGAKLSVSSRAMADFIPGEYHEGKPVMDPDNYFLDTFDVVRWPGIRLATPNVVELKESINKQIAKAENKPTKAILPVTIDISKKKNEDYSSIIF